MKKVKFVSDFKAFITKGNILDMAVGVIIGGAFGKIVSSLVADIIMPLIGALCNTKSLAELTYELKPGVTEMVDGVETVVEAPVLLKYGNFIMLIIDFLIVALCMFLVIKMFVGMRTKVDSLKKKEEEVVEEAPAEPTVEEKTLATLNDIKELLEKNNK